MLFAAASLRFYRRSCLPVVLLTGEVEYRIVGREDFPWGSHPLQEFLDQYRARFDEGARALIGVEGDTVLFSAWIASTRLRIDELGFLWRLPEGAAAVYDCVTRPEARGRGVYPEALRRLSGLLAEEGTRHLWIYAAPENAASIRGIEKAGFEYHGSIAMRRVLGWTRLRGAVAGVNA